MATLNPHDPRYAALEVSAHWDDLNLSTLLDNDSERLADEKANSSMSAMPSGMMNMLINTEGGGSPSKSYAGTRRSPTQSPVKIVTKDVLVQRHKKKWEKSNHAVLTDRYGAKPHKPPCIVRASLDRLSDPLKGRYSSLEDYDKRINSAKPMNMQEHADTELDEFGTTDAFLTGLDDSEMSPNPNPHSMKTDAPTVVPIPPPAAAQSKSRQQPIKGQLSGGTYGTKMDILSNTQSGFFLTAAEDSSPKKAGPGRGAPKRDALGAATSAGNHNGGRGGLGGRVNSLRNKVEEAGRMNRVSQATNRYKSTARGKLDQSVLGGNDAANTSKQGVVGGVRGGPGFRRTAGGRGAIGVKSSGYGSVPGYSRAASKTTGSNIGIGMSRFSAAGGTGRASAGRGRGAAAGTSAACGGRGGMGVQGARTGPASSASANGGSRSTRRGVSKDKDMPQRGRNSTVGGNGSSGRGRGGGGGGASRSRGASVSRSRVRVGVDDKNGGNTTALTAAADAAQKRAILRANNQAARAGTGSNLSGSSALRSASASNLSRSVGAAGAKAAVSDSSTARVSRGGGLAAVRERKQVTSAPVTRRGQSVDRKRQASAENGDKSTAKAISNTTIDALVLNVEAAIEPLLVNAKVSDPSTSKADVVEALIEPVVASPVKKKGNVIPLSKKDMLKSAASWRPTSDILKTLEGIQHNEVERSKAQSTVLVTPVPLAKAGADQVDGGVGDSPEVYDNNPDNYTTAGIAKREGAKLSRAVAASAQEKENNVTRASKKNNASSANVENNTSEDKKGKASSASSSSSTDDSGSMAAVLMAKANRLQGHFNTASKGFTADDAEAMAQSMDDASLANISPKKAMNRGPQTGRSKAAMGDNAAAATVASLHKSEDELAFARMLAADRDFPLKVKEM